MSIGYPSPFQGLPLSVSGSALCRLLLGRSARAFLAWFLYLLITDEFTQAQAQTFSYAASDSYTRGLAAIKNERQVAIGNASALAQLSEINRDTGEYNCLACGVPVDTLGYGGTHVSTSYHRVYWQSIYV